MSIGPCSHCRVEPCTCSVKKSFSQKDELMWRGAAQLIVDETIETWTPEGREIVRLTFSAKDLREFGVTLFIAGATFEQSQKQKG